MVEFPPGAPQINCAVCGEPFDEYDAESASSYANLVCESCDERAVSAEGESPRQGNASTDEETVGESDDGSPTIRSPTDTGEKPVFVDGRKCWRRYRFGGWVTMRDDHDCETLEEFYRRHCPDGGLSPR